MDPLPTTSTVSNEGSFPSQAEGLSVEIQEDNVTFLLSHIAEMYLCDSIDFTAHLGKGLADTNQLINFTCAVIATHCIMD